PVLEAQRLPVAEVAVFEAHTAQQVGVEGRRREVELECRLPRVAQDVHAAAGEIPQARVDLVGRAVVADLHAHEGPPHADVDAPGRTDVEVVVELAGVAVDATAERHPGARAPPPTALGPRPDLRALPLLHLLPPPP